MKLVLAIVQSGDADQIVGGLLVAGFRVTRLSSAGGFFRRSNVTLLIGVESPKVEAVLGIIRANIRPRNEGRPPDEEVFPYGATIFALQIERFVYL